MNSPTALTLCCLIMTMAAISTGAASLVPALFVFGDSTLDTGNLIASSSISFVMSQSLPYGRNFVPPGPTGRASNGKLASDYLAEFLGLPSPINDILIHQTNNESLLQGINFAAGGSGFLNGTGMFFGSIPFAQQLSSFENSVHKITSMVGADKALELLAESLFLISTGNNDIFTYVLDPRMRFQYSSSAYNEIIVTAASSYFEKLYELGARKFVVMSVGALGCTPLMLTLYNSDGKCIAEVNEQVRSLNTRLASLWSEKRSSLEGISIVSGNGYDLLLSVVENPQKFGFKYGNVACCGLGRFHGSSICNNLTKVCPESESDQYVFWDLLHPTQAMYKLVTESLISGPQSLAFPFNVSQLILVK